MKNAKVNCLRSCKLIMQEAGRKGKKKKKKKKEIKVKNRQRNSSGK